MPVTAANADSPSVGCISERESWGRDRAADIQVKSLQIAMLAKDAIQGDEVAYSRLQKVRDDIDADIRDLQDGKGSIQGFRASTGIGPVLQSLSGAWSKVASGSDVILRDQESTLTVFRGIDRFDNGLLPLKLKLDEVARAMNDSGAGSAQLLLAMRQINLADSMALDLIVLRSGAPSGQAASNSLFRKASMFSVVLKGFRDGDASIGVRKLTTVSEKVALDQVIRLDAEEQDSLATIRKSLGPLSESQEAFKAVADGSAQMLGDANRMYIALHSQSR